MLPNAMPNAVRIRELHRQELVAEAAHERLVRHASTMPSLPQLTGSHLRSLLKVIWARVPGQRGQLRPAVTDVPALTSQ